MTIEPSIGGFWQLYAGLLKEGIEKQYAGHEDYHMMLDAVDSDIPIYGCDVTVAKEDPRTGRVYNVTYHVTVYDDMGHVINGLDDVGGKCAVDGKIVAKGYIFTCEECGEFFCRKHVRFVKSEDGDVALCRYGVTGRAGCFYPCEHGYKKRFEDEDREIKKIQKETQVIKNKTDREKALADLEKAKSDRKQLAKGGSSAPAHKHSGAPIRCKCGFSPWSGFDVTCKGCGLGFRLLPSDRRACPDCGTVVERVYCDRCKAFFAI